MNNNGIKTHRGKNWCSSSDISVLKRKYERDLMNEQIKNQYFPSKISKFEVDYYIWRVMDFFKLESIHAI